MVDLTSLPRMVQCARPWIRRLNPRKLNKSRKGLFEGRRRRRTLRDLVDSVDEYAVCRSTSPSSEARRSTSLGRAKALRRRHEEYHFGGSCASHGASMRTARRFQRRAATPEEFSRAKRCPVEWAARRSQLKISLSLQWTPTITCFLSRVQYRARKQPGDPQEGSRQ